MPALRHALRADLPVIVDIWVDAFAADPYLRWIEPDDGRWPAFGTAWMTLISDLAFERGHTYLARDDAAAVAWIPPDLSLIGPDDVERAHDLFAAHAGGPRADEAVATILAARGHMTEAPHWTLQYLGVRSAHQGAGLGSTVVAPMLRTCDAEGLPCGLVSTNPRNVPFYEGQGFRVTAEVTTPDGAVTIRPMAREPS